MMTRPGFRKGIASMLGTIFFLAIIFSTIIPLQLYIKESDMFTTRIENEMVLADSYHDIEELSVSAYPTNTTSNKIMVKVHNKGSIPVTLERLWINESPEYLEKSLYPGDQVLLGPFIVVLEPDATYAVKVSTQRGRIFSADMGSLKYVSGTWFSPFIGINVQIANEKGKYYIKVSNSTWSAEYLTEGQDFGDLMVFFDVKTNGYYYVQMRKNSSSGPHLPGSPMMVEIHWPGGTPIVYIYTSGLED